jgi:hypothetical protein
LHDSAFLALLKPQDGNLAERLEKLELKEVADELYLSILSRKSSVDEAAVVAKVLTKAGDKKADAIGRLMWALLASMEFGVNH